MRTFIAIDVPDHIRQAIRKLVDDLRPTTSSVRWARMEGLHITLKFIGEIAAEKLGSVNGLLAALPPSAPFPIDVRGAGFFPNERAPRVLWLGVAAGPELARLAAQIDEALSKLGIARETRAFSPHLTLGRIEPGGKLVALRAVLARHEPVNMGGFTAEAFHLYESKLAKGGSIYTKMGCFPLGRS